MIQTSFHKIDLKNNVAYNYYASSRPGGVGRKM